MDQKASSPFVVLVLGGNQPIVSYDLKVAAADESKSVRPAVVELSPSGRFYCTQCNSFDCEHVRYSKRILADACANLPVDRLDIPVGYNGGFRVHLRAA